MIRIVRKADYPFLADWFAITLRWLVLVLLVLTQAGAAPPGSGFIYLVWTMAGWNSLLALLAISNQRLPAHRTINVLVDFCFTLTLFIFSGGLMGPVAWAGILVLLSAAIYFEWRGALLAALLVILSETAFTAYAAGLDNLQSLLTPLIAVAGINLGLGIVLGVLSLRLMRLLRSRYHAQLALRQEAKKKPRLQERPRLQTFYSMVETLSATLNYNVVLESALDLSLSALGEFPEKSQLVSAVLLFNEEHLTVGAARGLSPSDQRRTFPAEQGVLAETLRTGEYRVIKEPSKDPELSQIMSLQSCSTAICVPLLRGMNAYGVMLFAHPQPGFFHTERSDLLEMIAHQSVIAIQNARLFQDLEVEKNHIIATQEETHKKLARDLHDGPTQSVTAIAMRVGVARKMLSENPQAVDSELAQIEELARQTTQEIRHMLFTLRPLALETQGLISALNQMSAKMEDTFQQKVRLDIDPLVVEKLDAGKQTVVFHLVEEAVNNARKHAQASEIRIRLKALPKDPGLALLEIADNGKGFDVGEVTSSYERRGSLGMVNLQERADLISALLHIDSTPGKGTRVQVAIPLTKAAIDRLQRGLAGSSKS